MMKRCPACPARWCASDRKVCCCLAPLSSVAPLHRGSSLGAEEEGGARILRSVWGPAGAPGSCGLDRTMRRRRKEEDGEKPGGGRIRGSHLTGRTTRKSIALHNRTAFSQKMALRRRGRGQDGAALRSKVRARRTIFLVFLYTHTCKVLVDSSNCIRINTDESAIEKEEHTSKQQ